MWSEWWTRSRHPHPLHYYYDYSDVPTDERKSPSLSGIVGASKHKGYNAARKYWYDTRQPIFEAIAEEAALSLSELYTTIRPTMEVPGPPGGVLAAINTVDSYYQLWLKSTESDGRKYLTPASKIRAICTHLSKLKQNGNKMKLGDRLASMRGPGGIVQI